MTFIFSSSREICQQLAGRSKALRLANNISQQELAARAGIAFGTLRRFERGESIALDNFVRILMALGRADELSTLLVHETTLSIRQREALEKASVRRRASRKSPS